MPRPGPTDEPYWAFARRGPVDISAWPNSGFNSRHRSDPPGSASHTANSYFSLDLTDPAFLASLDSDTEPRTYSAAVRSAHCREAMTAEIRALEENETWSLEPLPLGKKHIGYKWDYKIKCRSDGSIERYKARLVAKGFTKIEGLDFHETFAPVAKMTTVRCLLTVALHHGWELHQIDVTNAFLHGDLDEEVYMKLLPGYKANRTDKVCRLRKSLYILRQASRNWFAKFAGALRLYGFVQSLADYSLFTYTKFDTFMSVLDYVDDLIVTGNNPAKCSTFKRYHNICFRIKDLGPLKFFLGIEITRTRSGLFLSQWKYVLDILLECGLTAAKPAAFPMEQRHRLAEPVSPLMADPSQFCRLVGWLLYLTIMRPELCYSVHTLAQFMTEP